VVRLGAAIALVIACASGGSPADAATITNDLTLALQAGRVVSTLPAPAVSVDYTGSVDVPQFDPALGELTSAELTLVIQLESAINYDSAGTPNGNATAAFSTAQTGELRDQFFGLGFASGCCGDGGGSVVRVATLTASPVALSSVQRPLFIGTDSVSVEYDIGENYSAQGSPNVIGFSSTTSASLAVTYEYVPVPEPGTMGLVLLGLAGVATQRRRTRSASSR